jgi:ribosomal-protein-alanine N-acetyltransferase
VTDLAMTPAQMARLHAAAFTMPRPWTETEIAGALADPLGIVVTESRGFLLGRVVADEAELLTIAVDHTARRQGIGQRLVARFLAKAQSLGAESVFLEVAATNAAARSLYEQSGFTMRGRRKNYYRDAEGRGVDALVLVWRT